MGLREINNTCENCIFSSESTAGMYCTKQAFDYSVEPEDFCSRFERKEEENC